ncbi:MAG: site-specific integrase [Anaerolineae bacterium]|nr:site-specific integrase [Anaerolineae bacterium]
MYPKFTPHDLRRSMIIDLIDVGVDLVNISRLVGHNNINTTAVYDRRLDARIQSTWGNIHIAYLSRFLERQGRGQ